MGKATEALKILKYSRPVFNSSLIEVTTKGGELDAVEMDINIKEFLLDSIVPYSDIVKVSKYNMVLGITDVGLTAKLYILTSDEVDELKSLISAIE